ncbi:MAG: RtcB family protein [Deltaproteobacteria bacterium]|nr:RtcB family protein [Deltaproteobacteria bacterium]
MSVTNLDALVQRVDDSRSTIVNPHGVPVTLFANRDVPIELEAVEQALGFVSLQGTLDELWRKERAGAIAPFWGEAPGALARVVLTPDFHRGGGIPVGTVAEARGFVVPQAVGNDVCCGMRLLVTDITRAELEPYLDELHRPLRATFFQGRRDIAMSPRQREALLREGLWGLYETRAGNAGTGIWRHYDARAQEADLDRVHFHGVLPAQGTFAFGDYIASSGATDARDSQIGSIGGGNHFVELQVIDEILDGTTAHAWGVAEGTIAIMAHSGSVGLGHPVGGHFLDEAIGIYPTALRRPEHGFYAIPTSGPHAALAARYLDAMRNAANFAFGNRLMLGLMATSVLSEVLGRDIGARLIYDAPHNLIWEDAGGRGVHLHRKGACPAFGGDVASAGPFRFTGHPVIIPGSMGAASYLLAGAGNADALASACHGAGRSLSRGKARKVDERTHAQTFEKLRVVTPIDPTSAEVRLRRDVLSEYHDRLKEEAPTAYKDITPVVQTVEDAHVARRVARMWPLLTIKG